MSVHYVKMYKIAAGVNGAVKLSGQKAKISGKDRRTDENPKSKE